MSKAKKAGGMGFKELEVFNDALLVKTAWRIIQNTDALWVRILKGLYFHDTDFLKAGEGYKDSWGWSSILKGRDAVKEGFIWQALNGSLIKVWEDAWIPFSDKKMLTPEADAAIVPDLIVEELIDTRSRVWDLQPIDGQKERKDMEAILRIPISLKGGRDRIVWPMEKEGELTVRSVYHYIKKEEDNRIPKEASTSHQVNQEVWDFFWKIKDPPKVRNFLWSICSNAIATKVALWRRGIAGDKCDFCDEKESTEHILLQCGWTKCVWFAALGLKIQAETITTIDKWIQEIMAIKKEKKSDKEVFWTKWAFTCWFLWKERS